MLGLNIPPEQEQMFVASVEGNVYGAGVIAYTDFMEKASERVNNQSFFILPSSIHELLIIPDNGNFDFKSLENMVKEVNATTVEPADQLTDNVYHYDAQNKVFELGEKFVERQAAKEEKAAEKKSLLGELKAAKDITTFDELQSYIDEHGAVYDKLSADHDKDMARVDVLKEKISAWERYKGFLEVYNKSQSLKGFARLKFDKENRATLDVMPKEYERFRKVIPKGEKITPDAWRKEIDKIIDGQNPILEKMVGEVYDLAYAEVLGYNRDNEQREYE